MFHGKQTRRRPALHVPGDSQRAAQVSHWSRTPNHSVRDTVQGRRQITVLETLHGVRDTSLLRPVWSSEPTNKSPKSRLDPSTVSRRHATMSETSRVRRHPTMSETSNPIRIWPSGSRPVFGSFLSRGRVASFRVWRWLLPVWCFRRSCRSFGGFSQRPFSSFWRFPVSPR